MLQFLLEIFYGNRLKWGLQQEAAVKFSIGKTTVSGLWIEWLKQHNYNQEGLWDITSGDSNNGGPTKWNNDSGLAAIRGFSKRDWSTLQNTASHIGVPVTTLHHLVKSVLLKSKKCKMKPVWTDVNKLERIHFCLEKASDDGLFEKMEDRVHIDKKMFYLSQVISSYYQVEGKDVNGEICRERSTKKTGCQS